MSVFKYIFSKTNYLKGIYKNGCKACKRFNSTCYLDFVSGCVKLDRPIDFYQDHYCSLPLPADKVMATYVWIDGSGINMRSKDRVLDFVPTNVKSLPQWAFDGSSTQQAETHDSDTQLVPCAMYRDPFRLCPHLLVLCETYYGNGKPTASNHRAECMCVLNKIKNQEPWFGIEQEYSMFDFDMWPLGWPKGRGFPTSKHTYSYCGNGEHVSGREIVECHARACLYAGTDFGGTNAEVPKASWEYQIGTSLGIKGADDLWIGRYILSRISEHYNVIITYHPKPMGPEQPGVGCHHNFSTKKMRSDGGKAEIERVCKVLCDKHKQHIGSYGLGDGLSNKLRLTGRHETASFDTCKVGVANRSAAIRLQRSVAKKGKGFFEDRRPAGDCDPYRVCKILAESIL